jgi:enamine deaminase RidA (YjgF/YER057c/UK114 family)
MMTIGLMLAVQAAVPPAEASNRKTIMPADPRAREFLDRYGFSEAVIDGDHVYLSGVVAGTPHDGDPKAAYDRAFRMIADVLKRSGSSWDSVIDMTTFHTDLPAQIEGFTQVKNRYVRAPFPAWTAIDVDRLLPDNGLVEIKVVARRTPEAGAAGE